MRVAKLHKDAIIPTRKHKGDAGFDLHYYDNVAESIFIPAKDHRILRTGIILEIPKGIGGFIWPKSGMTTLVLGGVIDSTYQGEILVNLFNVGERGLIISRENQIAQIIFHKLYAGDSWSLTETSLDEIHVVKSLRSTSGGIKKIAKFISPEVEILDDKITDEQHKLNKGFTWD
jgi:dUTP pyrophosphatase